ncbi:MAG: 2OG-Fe(II) oxygenase [Pseudomonadota bacterium]
MALLQRIARLLKRPKVDPKADPRALAAIGKRVSARLKANPYAVECGGLKAELFLIPNFVTVEECNRLIEVIETHIDPSPLFADRKSEGVRTSSTHFFAEDAIEPAALGRKIDEALGISRAHAETIQGQRYRPGEEYRHHKDYLLEHRPHWQKERLRGGQRSWTAMVYLNAVEAGGETDFSELGLTVTPEPGTLVTWNNMDRRGRPNRDTRHAALPVQAGSKYVITQWYRLEEWKRYLP